MKNDTGTKLNIDEILKRVDSIRNEHILDNVYSLCYDLVKKEGERFIALDGKAFSLIGAVGTFISLVFGFGGLLLKDITVSMALFWMTISYAGVIFFGIGSIILAIRSTKVRSDVKGINDSDILRDDIISDPNGFAGYKRYLAAHFWRVYEQNYRINEEKAGFLKGGFHMLFCAVVLLVLILFQSSLLILSGGIK